MDSLCVAVNLLYKPKLTGYKFHYKKLSPHHAEDFSTSSCTGSHTFGESCCHYKVKHEYQYFNSRKERQSEHWNYDCVSVYHGTVTGFYIQWTHLASHKEIR